MIHDLSGVRPFDPEKDGWMNEPNPEEFPQVVESVRVLELYRELCACREELRQTREALRHSREMEEFHRKSYNRLYQEIINALLKPKEVSSDKN